MSTATWQQPTTSARPHMAEAARIEFSAEVVMARQLDPVRFAVDGGFVPDPWQVDFLRSQDPRRMLNCSRQAGKSTTVAWGALHTVTYFPGSLVLLVSRGERQSKELMRKVRLAMRFSPDLPRIIRDGTEEVEFANGSRLAALPGKGETVRGYSAVTLLVLDEAALIPNDLYVAVRPMLAVSGGFMWTLSTPFGDRGWWYEQYRNVLQDIRTKRRPRWDYYQVSANECPRISADFLDEERQNLGDFWYMQEYFNRFLSAKGSAFSHREVDAAFKEPVYQWAL